MFAKSVETSLEPRRPAADTRPSLDQDRASGELPALGRRDAWLIIGLLAGWGAIALSVDPTGNFPLNDDWAYGLPVKWLVETGRLRLTDWQYMTLVTQILWGAPFALIAGFSFTALRISTLVIAAIGLAATYIAGRELGLSRRLSSALMLTLIINPVFLSLSESFHTDIPFWAMLMTAIALLLRGVNRGHAASYWAGWAFVLAATLTRQVGLAVAIGMVVAIALRDGPGRGWLLRALLPTALLLAVVALYPVVVRGTIGLPATYYAPQELLRTMLGHLIGLNPGATRPILIGLGAGLMHLGLWMLPLLIMLPTSRRTALFVAAMAAAVTGVLAMTNTLMPIGNLSCSLVDFGTGPRTLPGRDSAPHAPWAVWLAITAASAFGASRLVVALASTSRDVLARLLRPEGRRETWPAVLLIVTGVLYYAPFMNYGPWFDRYALPELALVGLLTLIEIPASDWVAAQSGRAWRARTAAAIILALVYLGFSIISAHDYLAWNRARWEAGRSLIAAGTDPSDIHGGFEFNAYHTWLDRPGGTYDLREPGSLPPSGIVFGTARGDERYILAFEAIPDTAVIRTVPVRRWSPLTPPHVLILERTPANSHTGPMQRSERPIAVK